MAELDQNEFIFQNDHNFTSKLIMVCDRSEKGKLSKNDINEINSGRGNDEIYHNNNADVINGGGGFDTIYLQNKNFSDINFISAFSELIQKEFLINYYQKSLIIFIKYHHH